MATKHAIDKLETKAPFEGLFSIDAEVLKAVAASIKQDGYDMNRPISVMRNGAGLIVVDGHTRLEGARKARVKEIPVVVRKFKDEGEALDFAIREQRDRRNLTKQQIAEAIAEVALTKAEAVSDQPDPKPSGPKGGRPKDPVKQEVVKKAADEGISEPTAKRGLAKARARRDEDKRARALAEIDKDPEASSRKIAERADVGETLARTVKKERLDAFKGLAPPEMREADAAVDEALVAVRKVKQLAKELSASGSKKLAELERVVAEARRIHAKENEA